MNNQLRPMALGEILDRTAQLYRRNFWQFAGVAAMPIGVIIAITALGGGSIFLVPGIRGGSESGFLVGAALVLFLIVAVPIYIAAAVFSYAGLAQAAVTAQRGDKVSIREALNSVRPCFWRYLWFIVLQGIVVGLAPGVIAAGVVGALLYLEHITHGNLATSALLGFLIFVVIATAGVFIVWLALSYSLGFAVCVVEKKPAWESLQRSWKLSQGTRGRIFVMYLLVIALVLAVSMVAAIPFLVIVAIVSSQGNRAEYATIAILAAEITRAVTDFVLQAVLAPVSWIALVLFYYDQRIRKEGFDIEWMMERAGLGRPAPAVPQVENSGVSYGAGISGPPAPPDTVEER